jgi:uncharacterized protein YbaP (TraB family)
MLGSIHLLKEDVYPLSRTIENAFEKSDSLAVEANVNAIGQADMLSLLDKAMYPGGDSIENHVSSDTYAFVQKEAERVGMPIEFFKNQRAWFVGLVMQSLELVNAGYNPEYGIDKYFLGKARGKKIRELESVQYQLNLLSGFSEREEELFLLYALKDIDVLTRDVDRLVGAWKTGDTRAVERFMTKSIVDDRRFSSIFDKLILSRNRNMTVKIEGYLQSGGTCFVVVGAAHLIGNKGIVQLLKDKGYSVEQL